MQLNTAFYPLPELGRGCQLLLEHEVKEVTMENAGIYWRYMWFEIEKSLCLH